MSSPRYKTVGPAAAVLELPGEDEQAPPVAAVRAVLEGPVVPVVVEEILDPPGQMVMVDGRVLSERLMFAFGFGGFTFAEIAEEMAASVMWVEVAVRSYPWLEEARQAGVSARDRDRVLRAERSADRLIDGHKLAKQKVTTLGEVVDYEEEVSPSSEMVKKVLETRARDKYGKDSKPVEVHVTVSAMDAAMARAAGAVRVEHREVQDG